MFEAEVNPSKIDKAELVVGVLSYNEADTISHAVRQSDEGLARYFPDVRAVVIDSDNNSPDHTKETFLKTATRVPKIYISTAPGLQGKGNNLRNLIGKVVELQAKAVVVVDADAQTLTPEWVKHLGEPLFKGFGFVTPLYVQHKYEGLVNHEVAYPLVRALLGRRVRQPIGVDFGLSGGLAGSYVQSPLWDEGMAGFGIGVWMTTLALNRGVLLCQAFVGKPKTRRPRGSARAVFRQVVGALFSSIPQLNASWLRVKHSKPTPVFGFQPGEPEAPAKVTVDTERLFSKFREGLPSYAEVWEQVLSPEVFSKLLQTFEMEKSVFDFPTDLWARILFDSAVSHRNRVCDLDLMVDSLLPLYFGKIFAFVKKTSRMSARQAEEAIEEDCMVFEMTKPYLVQRWLGK
ncbi:MAG: glycosyl transferase family protein [Deltaproteobacteria bacterium]|nr:glycosyl transferase family protein [Deltaproteobacteria bacterium]